jgi:hypothetical protein
MKFDPWKIGAISTLFVIGFILGVAVTPPVL